MRRALRSNLYFVRCLSEPASIRLLPMGQRLGRFVGIALAALLTITAVVQSNVIGAVFFGLITASLVWFAVRPAPDPGKQVHPMRMFVVGGLVFTLIAVVITAAAFEETDRTGKGLAVVAATVIVPSTLAWWGFVVTMWRRGWRWSSTSTRGELEAARASGTRLSAPADVANDS